MAKPRKKTSNPPKDVSSSTLNTEDKKIEKVPVFNGNFDVWKVRMRNFLMAHGVGVWESMIIDNMMDDESKEYNTRAMKTILNGMSNSIKANLEKCSSAKGIWDKLHDLHSKGALTITTSQEDDGKQEGNSEPIKEAENKNDDIKGKEDLEEEERKEDFEDLLTKPIVAMEEINSLKKEKEELKKKVQGGDQHKTRKEADLFKLQVLERDEELTKLKEELHQNKRKHHEEVISMTNQLDKAKKREETL